MNKNQFVEGNRDLERAQACAQAFIQAGRACGGCVWYAKCGINEKDVDALKSLLDTISPLGNNVTLFSLPSFGNAKPKQVMISATRLKEVSKELCHEIEGFEAHEVDGELVYSAKCAICEATATISSFKGRTDGKLFTAWCVMPYHTWKYTCKGLYVNQEGGQEVILQLFDNGKIVNGRRYYSYLLESEGETVFAGNDYGIAPGHATDSIDAVMALLDFLTIGPNDGSGLEDDWWENHSQRQLDWLEGPICEELKLLASDYEYAQEGTGDYLDDEQKLMLKLVAEAGDFNLVLDAPNDIVTSLINLGLVVEMGGEKDRWELEATELGENTWKHLRGDLV